MSAATQSIRSLPRIKIDPVTVSKAEAQTSGRKPLPRRGVAFSHNTGSVESSEVWSDRARRQLLVGHRVCHRCNSRIEIGPTTGECDPIKLVHSTCPKCLATQCRGCSTPRPRCPPHCSERRCRADAITCCAGSRAIAIFEVLSEFDKELSSSAAQLSHSGIWPVPRSERIDFLRLVTSRADSRLSNRFNKLLGTTVNVVNKCLALETADHALDPVIRLLFVHSFLFEAILAYLQHNQYINWAINARGVYLPVMKLLHHLGNRHSMRDMLMKPLPSIYESSGIQVLVWYDEGTVIWLSDRSREESLFSAAFSNGAQQHIAELEKVLERHNSASSTSNLRVALYKLLLLEAMGPTLP